ncbi:MAG: cytochrome c-type biogenesis protein CcmH [Gammaproteobacteria bacterium]|nr:MAG: cytochrome c-type biogenesis protein CcmH [Gammaproteobacteria bacterium]
MRPIAALLTLTACVIATAALAIDPQRLADPDQQRIYEQLIDEIRCPVSRNMSLADSSEYRAADRRRELRDLVRAGMDEADIKEFLVRRYGENVLYAPRLTPDTIPLWLAPVAIMAAGGWVLRKILRRRTQLPIPDSRGGTVSVADK